jgi:predicted 3-demethylubiquinone-9 3-methyltransferase (glyoxalase superfamily)
MQRITPCLWFDTEAEEAAAHYVSIFPGSRIVSVGRYTEAGPRPAGTVIDIATLERVAAEQERRA